MSNNSKIDSSDLQIENCKTTKDIYKIYYEKQECVGFLCPKINSKEIEKTIASVKKFNYPSILKVIGYTDYKTDNLIIIANFSPKILLSDLFENTKNDRKFTKFTHVQRYIVALGVALGMHHLHSNNFIHKNLQPNKIWLDKNYYPYISFEFTNLENDASVDDGNFYAAPEVSDDHNYSMASDVYAYSNIVYQLLTNKKPTKLNLESFPQKDIGKNMESFFNECINDPEGRPDFKNIIGSFLTDKVKKEFSIEDEDEKAINDYITRNNFEIDKSVFNKKDDDDDDKHKHESLETTETEGEETSPKKKTKTKSGSGSGSGKKETDSASSKGDNDDDDDEKGPKREHGSLETTETEGEETSPKKKTKTKIKTKSGSGSGSGKKETDSASSKGDNDDDDDEKGPKQEHGSLETTETEGEETSPKKKTKTKIKTKSGSGSGSGKKETDSASSKGDNDNDDDEKGPKQEHGSLETTETEGEETSPKKKTKTKTKTKSGSEADPDTKEAPTHEINPSHSTEDDEPEHVQCKRQADEGDIESMVKYADIQYNGINDEVDYTEAASYYKKAADKGNPEAMYKYGDMLRYSLGVVHDDNKALEYYEKAAKSGSKEAIKRLKALKSRLEFEHKPL